MAMTRPWLALVGALACTASANAGWAAGPPAVQRPETQPRTEVALEVASSSFQPNASMPTDVSAYGRNISPPLSWSPGPPGTKAFALLVEDPDASTPEPVVHWLAWNIPAEVQSLSRAMRNVERPKTPAGMVQGVNQHGSVGYSGPRPPIGDPPHHYHFQLFALDRPLGVKPGGDREAVLKAMRGHVLARGELVGLYAQSAQTPRGARRGASLGSSR
jgi:Raf kinase inhibitor-like YbhB/YbcL family protein